MQNAHEDHPVVFASRWALSYLPGPLTREQIKRLTELREPQSAAAPEMPMEVPPAATVTAGPGAFCQAPGLPPEIPQFFVPATTVPQAPGRLVPSIPVCVRPGAGREQQDRDRVDADPQARARASGEHDGRSLGRGCRLGIWRIVPPTGRERPATCPSPPRCCRGAGWSSLRRAIRISPSVKANRCSGKVPCSR